MNRHGLLVTARLLVGSLVLALSGCSGTSSEPNSALGGNANTATGGGSLIGGTSSSIGEMTGIGGIVGGAGGTTAIGGAPATGGAVAMGGTANSGGASTTGDTKAAGGTPSGGGTEATGGTQTGGKPGVGGLVSTGGSRSAGGTSSAGGASSTGGTSNLGTGGSTSTMSTGCTSGPITTATGTALKSPYGSKHVTSGGTDYFLQVNEWNSAAALGATTQVMSYATGGYFFKLTTQDAATCAADTKCENSPIGYPSIFIGANSKNSTTNSGLPALVSTIQSVPTSWTWVDNGTLSDESANCYNATYDVWFSTGGAEPTASTPSGGFLMVWFHKPRDAHPIGSVAAGNAGVTISGIPGTWDVWTGLNGIKPCISYVNVAGIQSLSFDLNLFIQDAVNNRTGTIQSTWSLTNVFAGFEIWRGGNNLQTTSFCAQVN